MPLNAGINANDLPEGAVAGLQHGKGKVKVVTLEAGCRLYRGGNTHDRDGNPRVKGDTAEWALSPWWFTEDVYKVIIDVYLNSGRGYLNSLGMTLRRAGAVKQCWSRLDVRIKAEVLQDINAFEGVGSTQFEQLGNGMTVIWDGWKAGAKQIYIPNLDRERSRRNHGRILYFDGAPALRVLNKKTIRNERPFGKGGT